MASIEFLRYVFQLRSNQRGQEEQLLQHKEEMVQNEDCKGRNRVGILHIENSEKDKNVNNHPQMTQENSHHAIKANKDEISRLLSGVEQESSTPESRKFHLPHQQVSVHTELSSRNSSISLVPSCLGF